PPEACAMPPAARSYLSYHSPIAAPRASKWLALSRAGRETLPRPPGQLLNQPVQPAEGTLERLRGVPDMIPPLVRQPVEAVFRRMPGVPSLPRPARQAVSQDLVGGPEADQNEAGFPESPSLVGKADVIADHVAGGEVPEEVLEPDLWVQRPPDVGAEFLGELTGIRLGGEQAARLRGELGLDRQRPVRPEPLRPIHQEPIAIMAVPRA